MQIEEFKFLGMDIFSKGKTKEKIKDAVSV